MGHRWQDGYSAEIDLFLQVNGERFRLEQVDDESFILRDQCEVPKETDCKIIVVVDGEENEYDAFLHHGIVRGVREVQYL